jgi:hypothetical protein
MNSPLETYLDELSEQLQALPIHERLEQVDETRAHLESLILFDCSSVKPLLLVSATLLTFSLVSELQYRLQFYLALEYGILTKRSFAPAPSHYPWAILFSFITSGALQEGHSIGWRRRLV